VKRRRAAVHRKRVARADGLRELLLELRDRTVALGQGGDAAPRVAGEPQHVAPAHGPPALVIGARDRPLSAVHRKPLVSQP
jgi:hypothetical protein